MTKPLFCILGASASGKTTLVKMLEKEFNMKQIPSYTTRSPRFEGEEGHTFVTEKEFKQLDNIVAYNYYLNNHYGVTASQIDDESYGLYVVDFTGLRELKEKYKGKRPIYSIFIDCNTDTRRSRLFARYSKMYKSPHKAMDITIDRLCADAVEFKDVKDKVNKVISNNDDIDKAISELRLYVYYTIAEVCL